MRSNIYHTLRWPVGYCLLGYGLFWSISWVPWVWEDLFGSASRSLMLFGSAYPFITTNVVNMAGSICVFICGWVVLKSSFKLLYITGTAFLINLSVSIVLINDFVRAAQPIFRGSPPRFFSLGYALHLTFPAALAGLSLGLWKFRHIVDSSYPQCARCGYQLRGLEQPCCPECGEKYSLDEFYRL